MDTTPSRLVVLVLGLLAFAAGCQTASRAPLGQTATSKALASRGSPLVTLTHVGGLPQPDEPPLAESHPARVVRAMVFADGSVVCATARGTVEEKVIGRAAAESLYNKLREEVRSAEPMGVPVDGGGFHLQLANGPDTSWPTNWSDPAFASSDPRVQQAKRFYAEVCQAGCRVNEP